MMSYLGREITLFIFSILDFHILGRTAIHKVTSGGSADMREPANEDAVSIGKRLEVKAACLLLD